MTEDVTRAAETMLAGLGGKENVVSLDNCITRLRMELRDGAAIDEDRLRSAGALGVIRRGGRSVQIIIGTRVQMVADAMQELL